MAERGNGAGRDDGFLADVLAGIGAPVNLVNLTLLRAWQRSEGSSASWNPFNTLQNGYGGTSYRGTAVKNYPTRAAGLAATIHTLQLPYYAKVRKALAASNPVAALNAIVQSPWAHGHYDAHKTKGGGYDYRTSNFWKVYQGLIANTPTAARVPSSPDGGAGTRPETGSQVPTSAELPTGVTSGTGAKGLAQFDPLAPLPYQMIVNYALPASENTAQSDQHSRWQVMSVVAYLKLPAATRKALRVVISPGAYRKLYDAQDPGVVHEITPFTNTEGTPLPGTQEVADAAAAAGSALDTLGAWFGGNLGRIGLGALGVLVILAAVLWANKGNIPKVVPIPI